MPANSCQQRRRIASLHVLKKAPARHRGGKEGRSQKGDSARLRSEKAPSRGAEVESRGRQATKSVEQEKVSTAPRKGGAQARKKTRGGEKEKGE